MFSPESDIVNSAYFHVYIYIKKSPRGELMMQRRLYKRFKVCHIMLLAILRVTDTLWVLSTMFLSCKRSSKRLKGSQVSVVVFKSACWHFLAFQFALV